MLNRRNFLNRSVLGALGLGTTSILNISCTNKEPNETTASFQRPVVLSTWDNRLANAAAWEVLEKKGSALDAVEQGVKIPEADPNDQSVGYGGRPDRDGNVTLDACIMDEKGNYGAVCALQHIKHPISVARKVMEDTPHVMLVGEGALTFAEEKGFQRENLLTETSKAEWKDWLKEAKYKPIANIERHDTIGMLVIDSNGDCSGACTTSGMAYKLAGRVGDSPIIGSGLFVDNEIGLATATGVGEAVLKSVGSFLIVELMRQGKSPQAACEEAVMRIVRKQADHKDIQVGYIAMNKAGEVGAYSILPGFIYVLTTTTGTQLVEVDSYL